MAPRTWHYFEVRDPELNWARIVSDMSLLTDWDANGRIQTLLAEQVGKRLTVARWDGREWRVDPEWGAAPIVASSQPSTPPARRELGTNKDLVDGWSLVHMAVGAGAGAVGLPRGWAYGLAALYEVAEYAHEYPSGSAIFGTKEPESVGNVASDMVAFGVGFELARQGRAA